MAKAGTARSDHVDRRDLLGADVGRRIRDARKLRRLTLAQLGGGELSSSLLSLVETGRSRISLRALAIVADRLELPISHFLEDENAGKAVELLLGQAQTALGRGDTDEALRLIGMVRPSESLRLRTVLLRGDTLVQAGRFGEAVPILEEAVGLARQQDDTPALARGLYVLGGALYSLNKYDDALASLRAASNEGHTGPDNVILRARIIVVIGHILFVQGDTEGALEKYSQARELFGPIGDFDTLACIYSALSHGYEHKGDLSQALHYNKLSLGIFEAKRDARHAASELNNMAVHYRKLHDLDSARSCAERAAQRAQQIRARDVEAIARSTLASIHLEAGDVEAAVTEAQTAVDQADGDTDLARVDGWIVLAKAAQHRGDEQLMDRLFQCALRALEQIGHQSRYADTALTFSLALEDRGDTKAALQYALAAAKAKAVAPV